jgi:hypothetical protein
MDALGDNRTNKVSCLKSMDQLRSGHIADRKAVIVNVCPGFCRKPSRWFRLSMG